MSSPPKVMAAGLAMLCFSFGAAADELDQWHRRNPLPTAGRLYGVAYGNNSFVAVGLGGAVAGSTDGTNWVSQNSATAGNLYGVAYGKGNFVAVGADGLILSSDGTNWNTVNSSSDALLNGIAFGADTFVAVGGSDAVGNATVLTSIGSSSSDCCKEDTPHSRFR